MGEGIRRKRGGIRSLCDFLGEHGEAVSYDLIVLGLRLEWLGTEALTWEDLKVVIRWSPRGSAVSRSVHGEKDSWGIPEHILAGIYDAIRAGNWQRGGGEGEYPEPLVRPGVRAGQIPLGADDEVIGGRKPTTIEEMNARLGWKP